MSLALAVVTGSTPEKVEAFKQIASGVTSGLFPATYSTPQKVIAACWAADALAVHPVTYMQGVHAMDFGGRPTLEPKWEFVNALLRSRLPGYDFEVLEETDKACEIVMKAEGRSPCKVRYTWDDAVRQGLVARNRATWEANRREMLFKQTFKRGGRRIGADVLMGLPPGEEAEVVLSEPAAPASTHASEPSTATVVEDTPAPPIDWQARLGKELARVYPGLKKRALAEKALFLWRHAVPDSPALSSPKEIGPTEACALVSFIIEKWPQGVADEGGLASMEAAPHDVEPAPEVEMDDEGVAQDSEATSIPPQVTWSDFIAHVKTRRKACPGRSFIKEAPAGSGKWYLVDGPMLQQLAMENSLLLHKEGVCQVDGAVLTAVNNVLFEQCDAAMAKGTER